MSKQVSISKVIFKEKCLSTLQSEEQRMSCFLSGYFSFPLLQKIRREGGTRKPELEMRKNVKRNVFKGNFLFSFLHCILQNIHIFQMKTQIKKAKQCPQQRQTDSVPGCLCRQGPSLSAAACLLPIPPVSWEHIPARFGL